MKRFFVIKAASIKYDAKLHSCSGKRLMFMVNENIELYWNITASANTTHKRYLSSALLFLNINHNTTIFPTK